MRRRRGRGGGRKKKERREGERKDGKKKGRREGGRKDGKKKGRREGERKDGKKKGRKEGRYQGYVTHVRCPLSGLVLSEKYVCNTARPFSLKRRTTVLYGGAHHSVRRNCCVNYS